MSRCKDLMEEGITKEKLVWSDLKLFFCISQFKFTIWKQWKDGSFYRRSLVFNHAKNLPLPLSVSSSRPNRKYFQLILWRWIQLSQAKWFWQKCRSYGYDLLIHEDISAQPQESETWTKTIFYCFLQRLNIHIEIPNYILSFWNSPSKISWKDLTIWLLCLKDTASCMWQAQKTFYKLLHCSSSR